MKIKQVLVDQYESRSREPFVNKSKIYVFIKDETLYDNLMNRRERPHTLYKKELIPQALEKIKKKYPEVYDKLKDVKWSWRGHCGCSMCPCSPGFISDKNDYQRTSIQIVI